MHPELESLLVEAETRYLKPEEITAFKRYVATIAARLKTYELLREKELTVFQSVTDELQNAFPNVKEEILERSLTNWLLTVRHCGMAMLLNDSEFLNQRAGEWLSGLVNAHRSQEIEAKIYQLLQARLKEVLPAQALELLQPFLEQTQNIFLT